MNRHTLVRRSACLFVLAVVCLAGVIQPAIASAYTKDDVYSLTNGTPFFDKNAGNCSSTSAPGDVTVSASGGTIKTAYDFFTANHLSAAQAAGIVGNLDWESGGVNPTQGQIGGGGGYGIAQWTPPTAMMAWVKGKGGNPDNLGGVSGQVGQLDYLLYDLQTGAVQAFNKVKGDSTVEAATTDFMNDYERPKASVAHLDNRIADAKSIYAQYGGGTGTAATDGCTGGGGGPVDAEGCSNPWAQAKSLSPERIDMGVDYNAAPGSPILAICPGKVIGEQAGGTGWVSPLNTQACVYIKISSGAYAGKSYYVCEDIAPTVKTGDTVQAGQEIATFLKSSTGLETGWGYGVPFGALAAQLNQYCHTGDVGCWSTAAGMSFNRLITATGGKGGVFEPGAPKQSLPAGYP